MRRYSPGGARTAVDRPDPDGEGFEEVSGFGGARGSSTGLTDLRQAEGSRSGIVVFERSPVQNPDRHDRVPDGRAGEPLTDEPVDELLEVSTGDG
jgi:hypothetical protein